MSTATVAAQETLPFRGTIHGRTTTDRKAWPALVKDAGPCLEPYTRGDKPVVIRPADLSSTAPYRRPLRVTLTAEERKWLGKSVTLKDRPGNVWQVWALSGLNRGCVWVVRDGVADEQPVSNLESVSC